MNEFVKRIKDLVEGHTITGVDKLVVEELESPLPLQPSTERMPPIAAAYFYVPLLSGQRYAVMSIIPRREDQTPERATIYAEEYAKAIRRQVDQLIEQGAHNA